MVLCDGDFEAEYVQECLQRQLLPLEGSKSSGGCVVVRCALLPVPWSGSKGLSQC